MAAPELTEKLREKLLEWEAEEGYAFPWHARARYLDAIDAVEGEWQRKKDAEKDAKDAKKQADRALGRTLGRRASA